MPNEPKWTPGPWTDRGVDGEEWSVDYDGDCSWCHVGPKDKSPVAIVVAKGSGLGRLDANAHLIAAAPDMAQALEGLISAVTEGGALDQARALFAASAALEKAKGGAA